MTKAKKRAFYRAADKVLDFILWAGLLLVAGLTLAAATGCSSAPPEVRAGGLEGTLVLRSPAGPVTIDLGSQVVVADGEGWGVESYQAEGWVVVDYQGISHRVAVDAENRCVVAHYLGVVALDYQIPGTECAGPALAEVAEEPSSPPIAPLGH